MSGYLISFAVGLAVGALYAGINVRSPAPPLIALLGLLGMVLGEQAVGLLKRSPSASAHRNGGPTVVLHSHEHDTGP